MNLNELKIMIDDRPLTTQIQEYVCEILNNNPYFKDWGIVFYPENALDIDFQIKNSMSKQGLACVVMTPTLNYQGHDALTQTFTLDDLTIQVVENTIINRARLKKEGKEFGTALDVASKASDILAGPQSGHFGEFTTKRIEQGEDGNLVVAKAVFGTTMYKQVDGIIEWDDEGHKVEIPFVTKEQIKNLEDEVVHLQGLVTGFDTEEIKTKVNELEQATNRIEVEITSLADVYQPIGNYLTPDSLIPYALKNEIPTKVSQLVNDSEFINKNQVDWDLINDKPNVALKSEIPTKTSELDNDAGFTKVVESKDYPGYAENANQAVNANKAKSAEVATTAMNVEWSNVSGKPNIPTKTSELENDSGYLSTVSWNDIQNRPNVALVDDIPTKVSQLTNDAGYLTTVSWTDVQGKPNIVEREYLDSRLGEYPTKVEMNNTIDDKISEIVIPENTKLYSPSKNRYIQGDSSVWETRTEPGHWTDWQYSDGQSHSLQLIYDGEHWLYNDDGQPWKCSQLFNTKEEAQNASELTITVIGESIDTFTASRKWIEGKTEFVQVETLAYESQLPTKVSDLTNDAGYLTTISWNDIQNIPNIALQSDIPTRTSELINDSGFITTSPDFSLYYTKVECNDRFQPIGNYLTEHQSLANYYTIEEIQNGFQVKGNYLTEHQSLANYYTKQECDERFGSASYIVKKLYSSNENKYIDGDGLVWEKQSIGHWTNWEWSDGNDHTSEITIYRFEEGGQEKYRAYIDQATYFTQYFDTLDEVQNYLHSQSRIEWINIDEPTEIIVSTRQWVEKEEYVQIDELATVKNIPTKVSQLNNDVGFITTVSWDELTNKPTIPRKISDLINDSQFITEVYWNDVKQKPDFVDETQLNSLRNDINSELNNKLNISDYNNTRLYSPTVEKFIDGDGKVWSNSGAVQQTDELAYKSDLGGINTRIGQIESTTNGLSTTVGGLSNRVDTAETRIGQVDERVNGVETSIETVQGTVGGIQTSVSQIQTSVSQVQTDLQNVQTNVQNVSDKVSTGQWIDLIGETETGTTITFQIFAKGI